MQTWAKYALSFFALILVLTGFIFAFGPASTRNAYRSGETATGQLRADHQLSSPGEATTASGTTQSADAPGPMTTKPGTLTNTTGTGQSPYGNADESAGNPNALPAK